MSTVRDYSAFMHAVAIYREYPYPERLENCKQRLVMNDKLTDAVFSAPEMQAPQLFLSPPPVIATDADPADVFRFPVRSACEIWRRSAGEIAALVSSHALSPVDVASAFLGRAEQHRDLNAFITLDGDQVMKDAEELATKLQRDRI